MSNAVMLRYLKRRTALMVKLKLIHNVLGYTLLAVSQVTIVFGVKAYNDRDTNSNATLGIISLILFFLVILCAETYYQIIKRRPAVFDNQRQFSIGINQLNERLAIGQELVVLDDLVLDISKYKFYHPGGLFVLEHNIGRDISKFFYGGYQLEN